MEGNRGARRIALHDALLPVAIGDRITFIGPPIWVWLTDDLVAGEYYVPATTFNSHHLHIHSDHAMLGLVPLMQLLPQTTRRPISM